MSAGIVYNQVSSAVTNPGQYYIPVSTGVDFEDSFLQFDELNTNILDSVSVPIFNTSIFSNNITIGTASLGFTYIYLDTIGGYILFSAINQLRINTPVDSNPPTGPAIYLPINVNGTNYKIKLQQN